uniref:Uncharacterized protein n=1 Tax=Panagrolaimus sp. PS1159 TaxID=55785 RepID=A0AC35FAE8_9BILA
MNGCTLFVALWELLDIVSNGATIKNRVKGIIFDSSPANVQPMQIANAVTFATLPKSKYSEIIHYSIEDFVNNQKERGINVLSQCWKTSEHVQHFRAHPEEYTEFCKQFLDDFVNPH